MADVGLDGTNEAGVLSFVAKRRTDRGGFNGVADRGSCSVSFDVGNLRRCAASTDTGLADQVFLGLPAWNGDAVGAAILVGGGGADDGVDSVAGGLRSEKRFQQNSACAFSPHKSIGTRVESLASPVGREHGHAAEGEEGVLAEKRADTANDCHGAVAAPQALAGDVTGR